MTNTNLLGAYGGQAGDALMFRNRIINGGMQVNQRYAFQTDTTFTGNAGPYFFTDRWFGSQLGDGVESEVFTHTSSVGAGELVGRHNLVRLRQYKAAGFGGGTTRYATILEPSSIEDLRGQVVTLSFYHRAPTAFSAYSSDWKVFVNYDTDNATITSASAASVAFESRGTNITQPTFRTSAQGTSDNWVRSSYSFTIPSNAERLSICFTTFSNVTNNAALDLTNVQLEAGPTATPFERRPYSVELDLCERYYREIDVNGTIVNMYPGTPNGYFNVSHKEMRIIPVPTFDTTYTNSGNIYFNATSVAATYAVNAPATKTGQSLRAARTTGTFAAGEVCGHTYLRLKLSAEL